MSKKRPRRRWYFFAAAPLVPPALYLISIFWIHSANARHDHTWNRLRAAAHANGMPAYPNHPGDSDLIHFYDESQPFQTNYGSTSHMQGFKNDSGDIVIPPAYRYLDKDFHDGLAFAVHADGTCGYIRPDQSIAFETTFEYVDRFLNGMAHVRMERPPRSFPPDLRSGYINLNGEVIVEPTHYIGGSDFVVDFALVSEPTIYFPLYTKLMDGLDIDVGIQYIFPPARHRFIDRTGREVPLSRIRKWISEHQPPDG